MTFCCDPKLSERGCGLGNSYWLELTLCKKIALKCNFRVVRALCYTKKKKKTGPRAQILLNCLNNQSVVTSESSYVSFLY